MIPQRKRGSRNPPVSPYCLFSKHKFQQRISTYLGRVSIEERNAVVFVNLFLHLHPTPPSFIMFFFLPSLNVLGCFFLFLFLSPHSTCHVRGDVAPPEKLIEITRTMCVLLKETISGGSFCLWQRSSVWTTHKHYPESTLCLIISVRAFASNRAETETAVWQRAIIM